MAKKFPHEEKYRISDQMIRASRSITANIAEGYGRYHYRDNIRFCRQSRGSLFELFDHIEAAAECGFIGDEEYVNLIEKLKELLILLNGYMKYLGKKKLTNNLEDSL